MTDRDALWAAILANPDDDLPRLVYADWLDENGSGLPSPERESAADRAAAIRTQIEYARAEPFSPVARIADERTQRLVKAHRQEWGGHLREFTETFEFVRGFIGHVTIEAARSAQVLPTVFETDPIQAIRILRPAARDVWVSLEPVFEAVELRQLTTLELPFADMGATVEFEAMTDSPYLGGLTSLSLSGNPIPPEWLTEFLIGPDLPALTALDLSDNPHLGPAVTAGLIQAGHRHFTRLDLSGIIIRSEELKRILGSDALSGVEELCLRWGGWPNPGPLTLLDLGWVLPWDRLRLLDLDGHGLGPDGVLELLRKPATENLRWLGLARNELGSEGVRLLTASGLLNLYYLDVRHNGLGQRDVERLRKRFPEAVIEC